MSKITLVVINPVSGGKSKESLNNVVQEWRQNQPQEVHIYETTGKNDFARLREIIDNQNVDTLIAAGGDGTLLTCAKLAMHTSLKVGLIPHGSANGMAEELGMPPYPRQALEIIDRQRTSPLDMLCFNDSELGMHISDIGVNANLVQKFEENENRGFLAYTHGVFDQLQNPRSFSASISCNDRQWEQKCFMIAFANARRYGSGALLNKEGRPDDGQFELCILHHFDLTAIAGHFLETIAEESQHMQVISCQKVEIALQQPIAFQIDGEVQKPRQHLKVEVIPACLQMIVP